MTLQESFLCSQSEIPISNGLHGADTMASAAVGIDDVTWLHGELRVAWQTDVRRRITRGLWPGAIALVAQFVSTPSDAIVTMLHRTLIGDRRCRQHGDRCWDHEVAISAVMVQAIFVRAFRLLLGLETAEETPGELLGEIIVGASQPDQRSILRLIVAIEAATRLQLSEDDALLNTHVSFHLGLFQQLGMSAYDFTQLLRLSRATE